MKLSEYRAPLSCKNPPQYNISTPFPKETLRIKLFFFFFPTPKKFNFDFYLKLCDTWQSFSSPNFFTGRIWMISHLTHQFQVSETQTVCRLSHYVSHLQKHLLDFITTENTLLVQENVHQQKEQFWSPKKMIKTFFNNIKALLNWVTALYASAMSPVGTSSVLFHFQGDTQKDE